MTRCISVFALAARKLGVGITASLQRAPSPQSGVSYSLSIVLLRSRVCRSFSGSGWEVGADAERERQMRSRDQKLLAVDEVNAACTGGDVRVAAGLAAACSRRPPPCGPVRVLTQPPVQPKEAASGQGVPRGSRVRRGFSPPSGEGWRMRPKPGLDPLGALGSPRGG